MSSLHIDLSSASPSGSIQTTTTPLDLASPTTYYYFTPGPSGTAATPVTPTTAAGGGTAMWAGAGAGTREGGRSGSLRRPHPCSMPATQSAYKRLPQRGSTSSSTTSTSSTTQLLYMSCDDTFNMATATSTTETRSQLPVIQDGYLETDVWLLFCVGTYVLFLWFQYFDFCVS